MSRAPRVQGYAYTPLDRTGWWGGDDRRPRCTACERVAFDDREAAERSAAKIRARGDSGNRPEPTMRAYRGRCGCWHVGPQRWREF